MASVLIDIVFHYKFTPVMQAFPTSERLRYSNKTLWLMNCTSFLFQLAFSKNSCPGPKVETGYCSKNLWVIHLWRPQENRFLSPPPPPVHMSLTPLVEVHTKYTSLS